MTEHDDDGLGRMISRQNEPPASIVEAVKASLDWMNADLELAMMVERAPSATVRGSEAPTLAFEIGRHVIEVEVERGGLRGVIEPAAEVDIDLVPLNGRRQATRSDDAGYFQLRTDTTGPARLEFGAPLDRTTPAFVI